MEKCTLVIAESRVVQLRLVRTFSIVNNRRATNSRQLGPIKYLQKCSIFLALKTESRGNQRLRTETHNVLVYSNSLMGLIISTLSHSTFSVPVSFSAGELKWILFIIYEAIKLK